MTIQSGIKVSGICLGIFTDRCNTIMARFAVINDTGMIESRSDEATRGVADRTILICWYVATCLTDSERTIVTGTTIIHDTNMIKSSRHKTCGLMTIAAVTVGWHMIWWRRFSSGSYTIVA